MIRLDCCSHVASLYPWFMGPKVLAKEIDPLHWRLWRLLNPDQERSVISDSIDGVWSVVYVGG
jgi:hypothetical protein